MHELLQNPLQSLAFDQESQQYRIATCAVKKHGDKEAGRQVRGLTDPKAKFSRAEEDRRGIERGTINTIQKIKGEGNRRIREIEQLMWKKGGDGGVCPPAQETDRRTKNVF